jgi:hypothetical protein
MLFEPEITRFFMKLGTYNQLIQYSSEMCCGIIYQHKKTKSVGEKHVLKCKYFPIKKKKQGTTSIHYIQAIFPLEIACHVV